MSEEKPPVTVSVPEYCKLLDEAIDDEGKAQGMYDFLREAAVGKAFFDISDIAVWPILEDEKKHKTTLETLRSHLCGK